MPEICSSESYRRSSFLHSAGRGSEWGTSRSCQRIGGGCGEGSLLPASCFSPMLSASRSSRPLMPRLVRGTALKTSCDNSEMAF